MTANACKHADTHRGADIPRRYGSWQSEVCDACGSFRARDHRGNLADIDRWREWRPASEYAAAIDDADEG